MTRAKYDFSPAVKKEIAERAMYICAHPTCYRLTGYGTEEGKARTIADAAHIEAAGETGPRAPDKQSALLASADNGIWLCKICHKKVDDSPESYSEAMLKEWKHNHEDVIRRIVGKDLEAALLDLRSHKRYHDETRVFLSFIESKRVLYEGMDHEHPPRVLDSLGLIRARITDTRAKVDPESSLFSALNRLQQAINTFLRDIGKDTDLNSLKCDCNDPKWRRFSDELFKLRDGMVIIIKILSGNADYKLTWL